MNTRYITLGTFVLVTLGAFVWLAAQLGFSPSDGARYTVRMDDAAGLVEGNAVRIAGVTIGKIESINVEGNQAVVHIFVKKGNTLFDHVCAASLMKGMLGEKFLGLRQQKEGVPLQNGADITCVDATVDVGTALNSTANMVYGDTELLAPVARLVTRLDKLTAALDEEGLPEREKLTKMIDDVGALVHTTREMVEENRDDVRAIARAGRKLLENPKLPQMLTEGERLLSTLDRRLPETLDKLDKAANRLEKASGVLTDDRVAKIGSIIDDGAASLKNLRSISAEFKGVGKDVAPLLKDLGIIARRASLITEAKIRQMLQIEGFRVRLGQGREARDFMKASEGKE